jgi:trk system potassium uptake protein
VVLFPFMRIGGMQLFKTESSEKGDKVVVQARTFAFSLMAIYLIASIAAAFAFNFAGMNWFDAINHMMTGVSTGGFSIKDASLGFYNDNAIYWAAIFAMILGSLPFTWYMKLVIDARAAGTDQQVGVFFKLIAIMSAMMLVWLLVIRPTSPGLGANATWFDYYTHATTNLISIVTTTGFVTTDYMQWGSFPITLFLIALFVGGCSGSTSGSIKTMRWQIFFSSLYAHFLKMVQPHRVTPIFYNGRAISDEVKDSTIGFIALFFVCWLVLTLLLSLTGLDFDTSLSAAAANIANVGPGIGPIVGPAGNYSSLTDAAKWILSFAMLLGRLEILVILLVFTPAFWRG